MLILCLLKILATISCWYYAYWRSWRPVCVWKPSMTVFAHSYRFSRRISLQSLVCQTAYSQWYRSSDFARTFLGVTTCTPMYVHVRHLQAWMFHPLVLYYTHGKLFVILIWKYSLINKITFTSLLGNMLYENKGLQCTDCTVTWHHRNAMNDWFMLEHNNDSMTVWMFQASGIILHMLEIVCYFNLKIRFIK